MTVEVGMSKTIDMMVPVIKAQQVKHWMLSRCLTKLDLSHGGEHPQKEFQTMEAFVDQDGSLRSWSQMTVQNR